MPYLLGDQATDCREIVGRLALPGNGRPQTASIGDSVAQAHADSVGMGLKRFYVREFMIILMDWSLIMGRSGATKWEGGM